MKLRALKEFVYDRRKLMPGDIFEQAEKDPAGRSAIHDVLTSTGLAEDTNDTVPPRKRRGRYKRRDMRAEDNDE